MTKCDFTSVDAVWGNIARVVLPREVIAHRVKELAAQVADFYDGAELTILAVLTGSLIFLADLVRDLPLVMRLDVASASSYPGGSVRSEAFELLMPAKSDFEGKDVLIVDDILDSGQTLTRMVESVQASNPASVRTCVLLRKRRSDIVAGIEPDYVGFDIDDEFVVGYGLDYNHLYRNLPDICVLKPEALACDEGSDLS